MKWDAVKAAGRANGGSDREGGRIEASHRENVGGTGLQMEREGPDSKGNMHKGREI